MTPIYGFNLLRHSQSLQTKTAQCPQKLPAGMFVLVFNQCCVIRNLLRLELLDALKNSLQVCTMIHNT